MNHTRILSEIKYSLSDTEMAEYKRQYEFLAFFDSSNSSQYNVSLLKAIMFIKLAKFDKAIEVLKGSLSNDNENNNNKIFLLQTLYSNKSYNYDEEIFYQIFAPTINYKIDFLTSAIFYAMHSAFEESIFFLKEFMRSLSIKSTVLHLAVEYGLVDLASYIINNIQINIEDKDYLGWTPLHWAAWLNRFEILKLLIESKANLEAKDVLNATSFYLAAFNGHIEIVKLLLEFKVDMQVKNLNTNAAIHMASYFEHTNVIGIMLNHGVDINMHTAKRRNTPLHVAAWHGKLKSAQYLLSKGANVNSKQVKGGTPLHRAALNGKLDMVKLLLKAGADINCTDQLNRTPLYCAQKNKHNDIEILLRNRDAI